MDESKPKRPKAERRHQHALRISVALARKLKALAYARGVSLNAYVNLLLSEAVEAKTAPAETCNGQEAEKA
jgi:predicted HicB family RNase H-like nuclease